MQVNQRPIRRAGLLVVVLLALATSGNPSSEELEARRVRVAAMDPARQQELLHKFERFNALPAAEQQRLRELQAAITADPNSERLLAVLEHYHEWLKTITTTERAKLAELPPRDRIREVEHLLRVQRDAQRLEPLTWQDMRDIRRWVDELVDRDREALVASIPGKFRDWYNKQTDPGAKQMALVYRLFGRSRGGDEPSRVTQADLDRLTAKLSEAARAELAKASTLEEQRQLVRGWIFASLRRSASWQHGRRSNPVVGEQLLQFLQTEVPPAERERLLQKPREEMLQELRKMYFERSGGPSRRPFSGRSDRHRHERGRDHGDGSPAKPEDGSRPPRRNPAQPKPTAAELPGPADAKNDS